MQQVRRLSQFRHTPFFIISQNLLKINCKCSIWTKSCQSHSHSNLNILDRTAFHRLFIHLANFGFQEMVKPNAGTAAIAFSKGMGYVHFHIFFDDFIKRGLRHFINVGQHRFPDTLVQSGNCLLPDLLSAAYRQSHKYLQTDISESLIKSRISLPGAYQVDRSQTVQPLFSC